MDSTSLKHVYHDKFPPRYTICQSPDEKVRNLGCIEIDVPPCQDVLDVQKMNLTFPLHQYPNPQSATSKELEHEIERYTGVSGKTKSILLTHGSDSALSCVLDSFLQQQSETTQCPVVIITVEHTYPHVESFVGKYPSRSYRLIKIANENDKSFFLEQLIKVLQNLTMVETPKLVYLPNPAMDGSYISPTSLQPIIDLFPRVLFVVDEAYFEFNRLHKELSDGKVDLSLSSTQMPNANVLTVRTFSKCFALASVRLGYMVGHKEMIRSLSNLVNIKDVTEYSKRLALAAIRNASYYIKAAYQIAVTNVDFIVDNLHCAKRGETGPFIFLSFYTEDLLKATCERLLDNHKILIRNKHSSMPGCARATVPFDVQDCFRFIECVQDVLRYDIVLWDLDQTLRHTAQDQRLELPDDLDAMIGKHHFVVTNNTVDSDLKMIQRDLPFIEDVWRPDLERLAVAHGRSSVQVTGPPNTLAELHALCSRYMSHVNAPDILITDEHLLSSWKCMSELKQIEEEASVHDFELPDVLFWARWLQMHCQNPIWTTKSNIVYCGKDSVLGCIDILNWLHAKSAMAKVAGKCPRILMVGDSITDYKLSKALLADFQLVKIK